MSARKLILFKAIDFLLTVESGPDAGKAYKINPPSIVMGRDPQCQIALTDIYEDIDFGVNEAVKRALDANAITIPFPQRDVHIIQENK